MSNKLLIGALNALTVAMFAGVLFAIVSIL